MKNLFEQKLEKLINETRGISIVFRDEKEYKQFKKDLKDDERDHVIIKDLGKSKYSKDTGGWYINVDSKKMDYEFLNWEKELQNDYPSVVIS